MTCVHCAGVGMRWVKVVLGRYAWWTCDTCKGRGFIVGGRR